jgi:membrane carboxypeptidase/penicillin-binding protein
MGYLDERTNLGSLGTGGAVPAATWERFMRRALANVPPTEFTEPAPIPDVRDEAMRAARGGFDPGPQLSPSGGPERGGFVEEAPPASVETPTTTTTTRPTTTTTSRGGTTTRPCFPFCN